MKKRWILILIVFMNSLLILAGCEETPSQTSYVEVSEEGLIAYWPFNGNAEDESGNENHGTIMGATLKSDRFGNENGAYEFNGSTDYITIPNSETLMSPESEITMIAWVNIYSWTLVGQQGCAPVLMKSDSTTNSFQYRLSIGSGIETPTHSEYIHTAIGNWNNGIDAGCTLNFNEWYLVAVIIQNNTVLVYLNGMNMGESTLNGPMTPDNLPLEIGRDMPGDTEYFHGLIDEIRIYNRVLSESEIQALYHENGWND